MSDSVPNRNQARPIDIRLGGEGWRASPPPLLLLPVFHCMSWESLQECEHTNSINLSSIFCDLSALALEATSEQLNHKRTGGSLRSQLDRQEGEGWEPLDPLSGLSRGSRPLHFSSNYKKTWRQNKGEMDHTGKSEPGKDEL